MTSIAGRVGSAGSLFLLLSFLLCLPACGGEEDRGPHVARVGDRLLTQEALVEAMGILPGAADSAASAQRFIDQWLTQELLHAEALRRGLRQDAEVRRQIEDSERSVLVSALLDELYRNSAAEPTDVELASYFEQHRDRLALLEPFVRVRYLQMSDPDSARTARNLLASLDTTDVAGWNRLMDRFSNDAEAAASLSSSYVAESRLLAHTPAVGSALARLRAGRTTPVIESDGSLHVVQLLDRIPAGTIPRMEWIESSLRQRLEIETRKQLYARLVQDLRNEAVARDLIDER